MARSYGSDAVAVVTILPRKRYDGVMGQRSPDRNPC